MSTNKYDASTDTLIPIAGSGARTSGSMDRFGANDGGAMQQNSRIGNGQAKITFVG